MSPPAVMILKLQPPGCAALVIPLCWGYGGREGAQLRSCWGWPTKRAMLLGGVNAGGGCCLHAEASTHSSPSCLHLWSCVPHLWLVRIAEGHRTANTGAQNWGIFFSPVVPNILLSFNFTASLQLLKCNSRKTAVKRKVFQSQHLINKETGNFLLQIQKRGLALEKQTDIFTVLRRTVLSDCECTPCSEY